MTTSTWDLADQILRKSEPELNEVVEALGDLCISDSGSAVRFLCPLHNDDNPSGSILYGFDASDPDWYSIRCHGCEGNQQKWSKNFFQWMNGSELALYRPHINPLTFAVDPIEPMFMEDSEGRSLIYPGEIHLIYGKPGTFKSWLLLQLVAKHDVRFLDFENGLPTIAKRLRQLGVLSSRTEKFDFPDTKEQVMERIQEYVQTKPEIICFDGLPGLARIFGVDTDSNTDIQDLFNRVLVPLKKAGCAVILLDHLPKDGSADEYPIGAQSKKSQSGVAYLLKQRKASDVVEIFVSKDRHYVVSERCAPDGTLRLYGWLEVNEDKGRFGVQIKPDLVADIGGEQLDSFDANLRFNIYDYVAENPDCSKSEIERNIKGRTGRKREATEELIKGGFLLVRQVGQTSCHTIGKPLERRWMARGTDN